MFCIGQNLQHHLTYFNSEFKYYLFLSIYLSLWLPPNTLLPHSCVFSIILLVGLPRWSSGKKSTCQCRRKVWSLGQEDPLEEEMATHSSILTWEIPWTEEPGGLQSLDSQRVRCNWVSTHTLYLPLESNIDNYLIFSFLLEFKFCEDCIVLSVFVPVESSASKRVLGGQWVTDRYLLRE